MNRIIRPFYVFDGPNGSGKTQLVQAVAKALQSRGVKVHATREPTDSELGRFIRSAEDAYKGKSLAYLVAADRLWHVEREILPALQKGDMVISDRYIASSLALQQLDGVSMELVWQLNESCPVPECVFMVSAPPEVLEARLSGRPTRSRFERTVSRDAELDAYRAAGDFLRQKGYNICEIENTNPLSSVVDQVLGFLPDSIFHAQRS